MRKTTTILFAIFCIISVLPNVSFGVEEKEEPLEMMLFMDIPCVFVATKKLEKVTDVPSTIYVIDKEEMQKYGLRDLKDVMWIFPGLQLSYQDIWLIGGQRGYTGNFSGSALMINGRDYTNMIAGETFISEQYGSHDMKQVELLQGPASALYGAQAMEGVINVVTRIVADKGKEFTDINVQFGNFNTMEMNGSMGRIFANGNGWLALSGRVRESAGDNFSNWTGSLDFTRDVNFQNARYNPQDPRYQWNPYRSGKNFDFYSEYKNVYFGGSFMENYIRCSQEYEDILANNRWDNRLNRLFYSGYKYSFSDDLKVKFDVEYRSEDNWNGGQNNYSASGLTNINTNTWQMPDNKRMKYNLETNYTVSNHSLTGGLEYRVSDCGDSIWMPFAYSVPPRQYYGAFTTSGQEDILNDVFKSVYAQDKWNILRNDRLLLYTGLRYDASRHTNDITTPRLGLVWHPETVSTIKFLYGKGYRTANVWEISQQISGGFKNTIPPRTMETYELGFERTFGKYFQGSLNLYKNLGQIYQQVYVTGGTGAQVYFMDVKSKVTRGFEIATKYKIISNLGCFLNYSYTDPDDTTVDGVNVDAFNVSKNQAQFGVSYDFLKNFGVSLFARWVDKIDTQVYKTGVFNADGSNATEVITLDSYTDTNLTLNMKDVDIEGLKFGITLGVKNLLNKDYFMNNPRGTVPAMFKGNGREIFANANLLF